MKKHKIILTSDYVDVELVKVLSSYYNVIVEKKRNKVIYELEMI